jgi:hypothetical protein
MATVKVNGVDVSTGYQPDEWRAIALRQTALDGEVGLGTLPVPDPNNTEAPYAGQLVEFLVGGDTIIEGFVGPSNRDRGTVAAGDRMLEIITVGDENAAFHGFRAYKWKRPAETTRARFLAFLAAFVPWVTDTTWVTTDNVKNLKAKTYTTETLFDELFTEIKDKTGCVAFIENHRAHLHPPTVGIASGVTFTDDEDDWNGTDVLPVYNPKRAKDHIDLRNDVMVVTPTASYTATDATSISRHDAAGLKHQSLIQLDDGDAEDAEDKATAIVNDLKNERKTYTIETDELTKAQVLAMPVGSLVTVTSAVLKLTASTQRIGAIDLKYVHPDKFKATLELGYPLRKRRTSSAGTRRYAGGVPTSIPSDTGGGCGGCPPYFPTPCETAWDSFDGRTTVPQDWGATSADSIPWEVQVPASGAGVNPGVATAWVSGGLGYMRSLFVTGLGHVCAFVESGPGLADDWECLIRFRILATIPSGAGRAAMALVFNTPPLSASHAVAGVYGPDVTPDADHVGSGTEEWYLARVQMDSATPVLRSRIWLENTGEPSVWHKEDITGSLHGGDAWGIMFDVVASGGSGFDPAELQIDWIDFGDGCDSAEPNSGQGATQTYGVSDGTTTAFRTRAPYMPGSLQVYADDIREWNITETDPATGAWAFDDAPYSGETIRVEYRAG